MTDPTDGGDDRDDGATRVSRRGMMGALAAGAIGLAAGGAGGAAIGATAATGARGGAQPGADTVYPFFGMHQAGITTPVQDRLHFASFDVADGVDRDRLVQLLREWSYASSRLVQGLDLSASGLTITIGFGPTLFEAADGRDRFGIAARRPAALAPLPPFAGDALRAERSGGDVCVQVCAEDPQVAVHAIRNLTRMAFGTLTLRWSQLGFGRTSSTSTSQVTPRNLFGFKDGTANIKAEDAGVADEHVWVQPGDGPAWHDGGSYLVARRIRMLTETWDRVRLEEQEEIFGRTKGEGGPLSGGAEFDAPDFAAPPADGPSARRPTAIAADSHVALAHPSHNGGAMLLRRGFNFVDGNDDLGRLDAGLFFLAYVRTPASFITVQRSLATDLLNEYVRHVGTGVWAIPPGATEGGYVGETLFGA